MANIYITNTPGFPNADNISNPTSPAWEAYQVSSSTTGAGDTIFLPRSNFVSVTLYNDAAGTAVIETTDSPVAVVNGETTGTAKWMNWSLGAVTASTSAICEGFTAIRINITSGTWTLSVKQMRRSDV
jgi:hypothetical protein